MKAPAGISKEAKAHFEKLVKQAGHRWEDYHADALAMYCESWQVVLRLRKEFSEATLIVPRADGQQQVTPLLKALTEAMKSVREQYVQLGLSPVSEARNKLEKPDEVEMADPLSHHRKPQGL